MSKPRRAGREARQTLRREAEASGRRAYSDLLQLQKSAKKNIYLLASHSQFFMDGIFNTDYWCSNGGVLPGWVVGTAGAVRYPLPSNAADAKTAKTNVYGYLLATVNADHTIDFRFPRTTGTRCSRRRRHPLLSGFCPPVFYCQPAEIDPAGRLPAPPQEKATFQVMAASEECGISSPSSFGRFI